MNLAGKPSRVGGAVASVAGAGILLVGLSIALGLGLLLYALVTVAVALAVALPIALVVLVTGIVLVRSGRLLSRSGSDKERTTHEHALLALAAHRGAVTARDAARALGVDVAHADAMLTALAKGDPERLAVDIDEQGVIWYRATGTPGSFDDRVRIAEQVRIDEARSETDIEEGAEDRAAHRR
ncbi:MAG: hypothetical protein M3O46_02680 [Myxococcota bacterium]|nr:hypothetical protein [Myxococcota bacterium]